MALTCSSIKASANSLVVMRAISSGRWLFSMILSSFCDFYGLSLPVFPDLVYRYYSANLPGRQPAICSQSLPNRSGLGLRFVRELEQGKETVRMDKVNAALAMFDMEAVPGRKDERIMNAFRTAYVYIRGISDKLSIEDNIKNTFLNPNSALFEEPENLLKQEVREPALYNAIITAIATGASRMSEISEKVGGKHQYLLRPM